MKYTFSDEEDYGSDALSSRRSNRQSGISTPAEHIGPVITASGRQVRSRLGGDYGESILTDRRKEIENERIAATSMETDDDDNINDGRPRRSTRAGRPSLKANVYQNGIGDDSEAESVGNEWSGDENVSDNPEDEPDFDADSANQNDEMSVIDSDADGEGEEDSPASLVVQLRYKKGSTSPQSQHPAPNKPLVQGTIDEETDDTIFVDQQFHGVGSSSSEPPSTNTSIGTSVDGKSYNPQKVLDTGHMTGAENAAIAKRPNGHLLHSEYQPVQM
jgi:hypothetical protein